MFSRKMFVLLVAAGLIALFAAAACDKGDGGGGSGLDDGLPPGDTDSDTGPADLCAQYPEADNAFGVGQVVRNYTFWDRADEEHQLCQYAGGDKTLMLLVLSSST
jgi:hypothetical protein